MIQHIRGMLNQFPRLKDFLRRIKAALVGHTAVSTGFVTLAGDAVGHEVTRLRGSWKADELPLKQRVLVERQLAQYRAGRKTDVFDVLVDSIRQLPVSARTTVLEIGCSSGYYSEVFDVAGLPLKYTGCDYLPAFVALARKTYPELKFDIEDAVSLRYPDASYDIVVSGCCLLHIPEYEAAIAETVRVAISYAIFHRTPVVLGQPNKYYRKLAYGVETVEIHFNEPQFLELLASYGLELIATYTLDESVLDGVGSAVRTYVCRKIPL